MKTRKRLVLWLLLPAQLVLAQKPVTLNDCQQWAREYHPLLEQQDLYEQIMDLKLENNRTNYLPQVGLNAQATYQSDVTEIGLSLPSVDIPEVAKDQYKLYLDVKQNIWDGGLTKANELLEKAREETNQQSVEVELYKVQEQVNSLFFTSFLIQQNLDLLAKKRETLEARKNQMGSAVKNGTLLQSELNQILAELVKIRQQQIELQSHRETVLSALAILTGRELGDLQNLVIETNEIHLAGELNRPELTLFEKQTDMLAASSDLLQKKRNPKLFGFGQAGYGRPGLNMLNDEFDAFYLVGLGASWSVFDWKNTRREREVIQLQQQLVSTQQQQFERQINIALDGEYRKIQQIQDLLESDRELIVLQEQITKSAASKLENGTITASDYLQDLNAEMGARITFETHKVQLEAAKINYRNIQGTND
jgi:outer membrane protein TolC